MGDALVTHPILTGAWQLLKIAVLVIAIGLIAVAIWVRIRRERTVFVRTFGHPSTDPDFGGVEAPSTPGAFRWPDPDRTS